MNRQRCFAISRALIASISVVAGVRKILAYGAKLSYEKVGISIVFSVAAECFGLASWAVDGAQVGPQLLNFFKNVSIAGGLFFVALAERDAATPSERSSHN